MALQGTIDSFPVVDVLGLLSASAKTGCLELTGDRGHGSLWLREGRIVDGSVRDRPTTGAADVVFELLLFETADFEFVVGEPGSGGSAGSDESFDSSVTETVQQAEAMLEIWQQVREVVPELSMTVILVAEIECDEVRLSAAEWSLVARCVDQPTVGGILRDLGLGEFDGCRRLADLIERGLIEVFEAEEVLEDRQRVEAEEAVEAEAESEPAPVGVEPYPTGGEGISPSPIPDGAVQTPAHPDPFDVEPDTDFIDDDQGASEFPDHFPIDDLVGSGERVAFEGPPGVYPGHSDVTSFSTEPGHLGSPPTDEFAASAAFTDTHLVGQDRPSASNDDVLAQIGRLSPKAAEAIAAALGDGDDG